MLWFVLLSIVVVGVGLSVAFGRLPGALPGATPDGRPINVPENLTAEALDGVRLPVAARGYRMADVDDLMDRMSAELRSRDEQIARLTGQSSVAGLVGDADAAGADADAADGAPSGGTRPDSPDAP